MADYIISCCSTADMTKEHFEAIDVKYLCFHYKLDGVEHPDDLGQTQPVAMVDLRQIAPSLQRSRQIEKPRILPVQADLCLQPDITKQDLLFHLKRNPHHPVFLLKRQKRIHDPVAESPGGIAA